MKALLVYPPIQFMDVETPRPDGSLGPLYLASALERAGVYTDILDASVGAPGHDLRNTFYRNVRQQNGLTRIGMSFEEIADYVAKGNYDVVGIHSNFTPQTNMALETARAIKKASPQTRLFAGGVNARALLGRFLGSGCFEGVCLTDGEIVLPRAVYDSAVRTPGFAYTRDGENVVNPADASCFPASLDDLAMPAWHKLAFDKYDSLSSPHGVDVTSTKGRYAPIMTSRGCPFRCTYCHISTERGADSYAGQIGDLRLHSIERVIKEVDAVKALGVRKVFFEDDSLLAERERVKKIFRTIADRELSISNVNGINLVHLFDRSRPREDGSWPVDGEYLDILRAGGFDQIVFPVESGSPRILRDYATNKVSLKRMDLVQLMGEMTRRGINAPVNMMMGFPDETETEIAESVALAQRLRDAGAPYVTFFIPIPFPGSKLFSMALERGYLPSDFNPDDFNWKRPVMRNTTVAPERLEELRDAANESVNSGAHLRKRLEDSIGHRWTAAE